MIKHVLCVVGLALSATLLQAQDPECVEIFISEYVEGWSNNKAIELYNPTDETVDLSNYRLERYSNGSTTAPIDKRLDLTGMMPPLSVYVIVIDKRDSTGTGQEAPVWDELQAKADTFACPVYDDNNVMYFNGNDAMVLKNTSQSTPFIIDRLGKVGEDPGVEGWNDVAPDYTFAGNGITGWTKDHSLIRKSDIVIGDFNAAGTFDPSVQWDSIPPTLYDSTGSIIGGNWASLGVHECTCGDVTNSIQELSGFDLAMYPNPASDFFIIESEDIIKEVQVYSMSGRLVFSSNDRNERIRINSQDWNSGYYLVNIRLENGFVSSQRIIIE